MIKDDFVIIDKNRVFIDDNAKIGKNVIIYENCRIDGACNICDNATIFPNSFLTNSIIGKGTKIYSSVIENSKIGERCFVGPFCFIKNSKIDNGKSIAPCSAIKNKK